MNFWWLFEPHFFRVYYFSSKQEACQEVLLEQEVNEIMSGCHPSYLKTVLQQVWPGFEPTPFEPTPFDFWLPTPQFWLESYRFTPILVAYNGWLKWLNHQKFSYLGNFYRKILTDFHKFIWEFNGACILPEISTIFSQIN